MSTPPPTLAGAGPRPRGGEIRWGCEEEPSALSSLLRVDYRSACKLPSSHRAKRKPSDILVNKSKLLSQQKPPSHRKTTGFPRHPQHHEGNAVCFMQTAIGKLPWGGSSARTPELLPGAQRPRCSSAWGHGPRFPRHPPAAHDAATGPLRTPVGEPLEL